MHYRKVVNEVSHSIASCHLIKYNIMTVLP